MAKREYINLNGDEKTLFDVLANSGERRRKCYSVGKLRAHIDLNKLSLARKLARRKN